MTGAQHPARAKARGCTAGVILAAASGIYPATYHPYFAIPGLVSAAIFAMVAASYRREAHEAATQDPRSTP
ncbi:hypothetical protein F8R89_30880 [Streptomyces sp. SS1-1]|uniref:hypothetical protein n=1 Tax=Streptomyces sp. SS1-1 TaxID=2651869 RepID=UPI00124F9B19|nr:hypothetical protein [Streptomyces sp. SS1-1]KAB2976014.1 hypothetical protein F8R89_30880 [Streptomyces sp. SS1-1]